MTHTTHSIVSPLKKGSKLSGLGLFPESELTAQMSFVRLVVVSMKQAINKR